MSNDSALPVDREKLPIEPGPLPWSWFAMEIWANRVCSEPESDLSSLPSELSQFDPAFAAHEIWPAHLASDTLPSVVNGVWRSTGDLTVDNALERLWRSGLFLSQAMERSAHEIGLVLPFQAMAWSVLLQGHLWMMAAKSPVEFARWLTTDDSAKRHQIEVQLLGVRALIWSQITLQKLGLDELASFLWCTRDLTSVAGLDSHDLNLQSDLIQALTQAFRLYAQCRFALIRKPRSEITLKDPKATLVEARVDRLSKSSPFLAPRDEKLVERTTNLVKVALKLRRNEDWVVQAESILQNVENTASRLLPTQELRAQTGTHTATVISARGSEWLSQVSRSWNRLQDFWWNQLERFDNLSDSVGHQQVRSESQAQALRFESLAEFAAGAGHELNNPLAVIQGRAQLLLAKATDQQSKLSLKAIVDQTLRAHRMLRDLIYIARPSEPIPRYFRPADTLRSVARELSEEAQRREILIDWTACHQASRFETEMVDPDGFRQIVLGLSRNALEASADQSQVQLSLAIESGGLKLQVTDHGHGFDTQEAAHLFDPFYCGRKAGRGLGLGLPRLARVVAQMNGKIRYRSKPGQGSTFEVMIPLPLRTVHSLSSSA